MSPTSYQAAPSRDKLYSSSAEYPVTTGTNIIMPAKDKKASPINF